MNDVIEQFRQAIGSAGLPPPDTINADGAIHRFSTNGKRLDKSGWYICHSDGVAAGVFGGWREGFTQTWCSKTDNAMTESERQDHRARVQAMQAQRFAELMLRNGDAAAKATRMIELSEVCTRHPYLTRKGIQANGARQQGVCLLIPMCDTTGAIHSLQTIMPDGDKRFLAGGRVKGCYFAIGGLGDVLVICEGFATGASIYAATGHAVAVAFNSGNLSAVCKALRQAHPDAALIVAADDDHLTAGNPGLTAAREAALSVGGFVVVPQFPAGRPDKATDFNDLAALADLQAVRTCFLEIESSLC